MAPQQIKSTEQEQQQNQQEQEDPVVHPTDGTEAVAEPEVVQRSVRPLKGSQRRRSKAEMSKRPDWLPPDWQIELTIRRKGRTKGAYDPHYISPSGVKYRSKISVEEALKLEEESGNVNAPATSEENTEPAKKR